MAYVHTEHFRVRHYECDAYGAVNHANYLRYMQEAAFAASAAVGYTPQRYAALNLQWLAYETDIAYMQPLHYNDQLSIKTWVHDFRRVRSLRNYEFYRNGELITQANTDWVLIDTERMYPATIPQPVIDAYSAGDPVETAPKRIPLPPAKIPLTGTFSTQRRVAWSEIDGAQHVNNAIYLNYVEDCEMQAMAAYGWPLARVVDSGAHLAVRRHQIEYKQAAVLADEIDISTWIARMDDTTQLRHFVIKRLSDDKLLARVRGLRQWVRLSDNVPTPIPTDYREAMQGNLIGG